LVRTAGPDETHIRAIPGDEEMLFSINQSDPSDADFDLLSRLSNGELYGIRPDREATTAIGCGDDHLLLCLDASENLTGLTVDRRRGDRTGMHVQPNTRTLTEHRGLPHMSDRPTAGLALGNPRDCVSEAPASNHPPRRAVTPYGLSDPACFWRVSHVSAGWSRGDPSTEPLRT
jgi:hypothetical protein